MGQISPKVNSEGDNLVNSLNDSGLYMNVVGEGDSEEKGEIEAIIFEHCNTGIIWDKAMRRLSNYFREAIGERELRVLTFADTYLKVYEREGFSPGALIRWTGYNPGWLRKVAHGIHLCLEKGFFEVVKYKGGELHCITFKGQRVLDVFNKFCYIVIQEMRDRHFVEMQKRSKKRRGPVREGIRARRFATQDPIVIPQGKGNRTGIV